MSVTRSYIETLELWNFSYKQVIRDPVSSHHIHIFSLSSLYFFLFSLYKVEEVVKRLLSK